MTSTHSEANGIICCGNDRAAPVNAKLPDQQELVEYRVVEVDQAHRPAASTAFVRVALDADAFQQKLCRGRVRLHAAWGR
jgi:hypothetical protein